MYFVREHRYPAPWMAGAHFFADTLLPYLCHGGKCQTCGYPGMFCVGGLAEKQKNC